jgi:hypothetical protein
VAHPISMWRGCLLLNRASLMTGHLLDPPRRATAAVLLAAGRLAVHQPREPVLNADRRLLCVPPSRSQTK